MIFSEVPLLALTDKCLCKCNAVRRLGSLRANPLLASKIKSSYNSSRNTYKKIVRPNEFKLVSRPIYNPPSLAEHLRDRIRLGGPISVADYMRAVLTHPRKGYYIQGDVFGQSGDFTTSPEISPLFGELVGVWFCHELRKIGSPRPLQLVELGPGRGTLTADVLRVFKQLPPGDADISIHLVEISDRLAQLQARHLGATELTQLGEKSPHYQHALTDSGRQIFWYRQLQNVPRAFSVFIAHEFFDALPIHKLQKVDGTWRELQISLKNPEDTNPEFQITVSRTANPPISLLLSPDETRDHVEVCVEAGEIAGNVAQRLEEDGGIALVVDYGHEGTKTDTWRGFKSHKLHDPLVDPGTADLTADVDFTYLKRAAGQRVVAFGPVTQSAFLKEMGIDTRLQKICDVSPEQAEALKSGAKMITEDMGERFKFMAMYPAVLQNHLFKFPVAGFSSQVPSNTQGLK